MFLRKAFKIPMAHWHSLIITTTSLIILRKHLKLTLDHFIVGHLQARLLNFLIKWLQFYQYELHLNHLRWFTNNRKLFRPFNPGYKH